MALFKKTHKYLVSYIIPNQSNIPGNLGFGNSILASISKGEKLINIATECVIKVDPNAVIMSICKVD